MATVSPIRAGSDWTKPYVFDTTGKTASQQRYPHVAASANGKVTLAAWSDFHYAEPWSKTRVVTSVAWRTRNGWSRSKSLRRMGRRTDVLDASLSASGKRGLVGLMGSPRITNSRSWSLGVATWNGRSWSKPHRLAAGPDVGNLRTAIAANGRSGVAVWNARTAGAPAVYAARWSRNRWSAPVRIAFGKTEEGAELTGVSVSRDGAAVIASWRFFGVSRWGSPTGTGERLQTARWSDDRWGSPVTVDEAHRPAGTESATLSGGDVAIAPNGGQAHIVWVRPTATGSTVLTARTTPAGSWSALHTLGTLPDEAERNRPRS